MRNNHNFDFDHACKNNKPLFSVVTEFVLYSTEFYSRTELNKRTFTNFWNVKTLAKPKGFFKAAHLHLNAEVGYNIVIK